MIKDLNVRAKWIKISEGWFEGSHKEKVHNNGSKSPFSYLSSKAQAVKEKSGFYLN